MNAARPEQAQVLNIGPCALRRSNMTKPPTRAASSCSATLRVVGLVQLGADVLERGVQLGAEALHDRDDRDRDTGGDQTYSMAVAPSSLRRKR